MANVRKVLWILAGAACATALGWALAPRPTLVEVAVVTRGPFEQTLDEDGKTRARERYLVSAPLAGSVERLELKAGDPVARGDLLAVIVPSAPPLLDARSEREAEARVGAAEGARQRAAAAAERADVALRHANAELERTRRLAEAGLATRQDLERAQVSSQLAARGLEVARFEAHVADHDAELARASLLRLRQPQLAGAARRWELHSPVSGRVLRVIQESEAAVGPGAPLLELADPANLEVVVDVLTTDAGQVAPGTPVRLTCTEGCEPLAGRVRRIEPAAFTKVSALGVEEQRVNVVIDITSPQAEWRGIGDGYRVDAHFLLHRTADGLKVPSSALFRDGGGWATFVLADGRARRRPVRTQRQNASEALIEDGLQPGERVIVYPADSVRDGARVRLK